MKPGIALFVMFPLVVLMGAFVFVTSRGAGAGPVADGVYWDEELVRFVRRQVSQTYVDEVDEARGAQAFYRAMDAYVHDLDEYCDFLPPDDHRRWKEQTRGRYAGLGIKIQPVPEGLHVVGVLPGGPAHEAGIHRGDTLLSADGYSLAGLTLEEVESSGRLKGPRGSAVTLRLRPGPRTEDGPPPAPEREVTVTRDFIRPPTVFVRHVGTQGEFGVIRLREFAEASEEDFDEALDKMRAEGLQGVVLDLRGNGGGLLTTAVAIVDRFVERGVIVRMEGRGRRATRVYEAKPDGTVEDALALVVLVDGGSASASEVVAGALQDHRRALLVGERTFGKFLVQQITEIPGRQAAVQLTTSRYYLPSGRSYQRPRLNGRPRADGEGGGLIPDVVVDLDEEDEQRLDRFRANEEAVPWGEEPPFPDVPSDWVDPQLERALEALQGHLALRRIRSAPGAR